MGAREDFEALRHAGGLLDGLCARTPTEVAMTRLFQKAGARELAFLDMSKRPFCAEVIDLAWAVLGKERPGGSAVEERDAAATV